MSNEVRSSLMFLSQMERDRRIAYSVLHVKLSCDIYEGDLIAQI